MPEEVALATTKRKFYKALDSFTTSSQVSIAPSPSESITPAKRPATAAAAFDEARERAAKRLRHSTSSSSLPYELKKPAPAQSRKRDEAPQEPPNFSPWSHETFLARLKTFSSVSAWHPKPEAISEVEWAKRGWVCVDVNTVACKGGCERRVVVSMDFPRKANSADDEAEGGETEDDGSDDEEAAFEKALVERYRDVVVEGHAPNCLWRKSGCKDDIYRLQVVRPSIWQPELRSRFESARDISETIRDIKINPISKDGVKILTPERLIKDLPEEILGDHTSTTDSESSIRALDVALHGWRGSVESGSELLSCDACFQRIGLWMYQPGYHPARLESDDSNDENLAVIDLVEMHREHCPWRNPATQRASGNLKGQNGCEILQRIVSTYARDHRRRSNESEPNTEVDQQNLAEMVAENAPVLSREEVARQDKDRESRLRKIKNLFTIKRRSKAVVD